MSIRLLAMWSGPRNISTAMMRSWDSRADTLVIDEPFYAHYLKQTHRPDPGAAEIIATQSTQWQDVVRQISVDVPNTHALFYQKHITTHIRWEIELGWLDRLSNCFLIRDPERVVASYIHKRPEGTVDDLGYAQQFRIFEHVRTHIDARPVVIDTERFLRDPASQLAAACAGLNIEFDRAMLEWEPGIRSTDGVWHKYWYDSVAQSTGFLPYTEADIALTDSGKRMAERCQPIYEKMLKHALSTD